MEVEEIRTLNLALNCWPIWLDFNLLLWKNLFLEGFSASQTVPKNEPFFTLVHTINHGFNKKESGVNKSELAKKTRP